MLKICNISSTLTYPFFGLMTLVVEEVGIKVEVGVEVEVGVKVEVKVEVEVGGELICSNIFW